jgi:sarcosine oxidase gamma subunit
MMRMRLGTTVAALALALVACNDDNGPSNGDTGTLTLRISDAPGEEIESAVIYVSQVYLVPGSEEDGERVVISDTPASYDLLALQGGVTALLGSEEIPVGSYEQLRMVVDSARVTLVPPILFEDGTNTALLKVPSGGTSGLKVNLSGPIEIVPGETIWVVDFDVGQSFVFQGPPGGPKSVSFKPVIHASAVDVAGSISGTVTPASANATVYAIVGTDTITTTTADGTTGAYTLAFLPPGNYTVLARATGYADATLPVTVGDGEDVTGVDFTLTATPGSISGTVTPAASAATVYAIVGTDTVTSAAADVTTGAYTLANLPPDSYTVTAHAVGFQDGTLGPIVVAPGQAVVDVNFTLSP